MEIDARGLACPQPVLMIKAELEKIEEGVVTILVDNKGSSINVKNFCEANGHTVSVDETDGYYKISAAKGYDCAIAEETEADTDTNIVVFITGETLGDDKELGAMLMKGFIGNLKNMDILPKTVIFVNNSVKLLTFNEDVIASVRGLVDSGVEILACGMCLEFYGITDKLAIGRISDAYTVADKLFKSDKLIRL
ncbi:selenium metabolism protein YedF [Denitrovibrio acetiphilus DSM 12809]|uniref:Selenium metabolism protein YedF n=1 Tax=Denitrovibrio acetiphilus (strain DSM 12809 / NBRC 114555 / N2460) TaxID=522772 RepID=D4H3D9_DENA2|nr:sulfurtransferase-like selenium metabolism protein YedF [Denitrovibrio acetiphilus]ADD67223.1 selenium metabolism protein YedF [Denitrovibrio acetiphilus DSM 12809]